MKSSDKGVRLRRFHQAKWDEPIIFHLGGRDERGILVPEAKKEVKEETGKIDNLIPKKMKRKTPPLLPELGQMQVLRHFLRLSQETIGADLNIDIGLGTCTMKYNPKIHETFACSSKVTELHPYQDESTVQGMLEIIYKLEQFLKQISGMDKFSLHPSSGTQAIYSNAAIVRAYHEANGEAEKRDEIITTIFSHPGNAGAASTAGFKVLTLMPDEIGFPDLNALKSIVSERTAGLFITNPEDTGIFNSRIKEYVNVVHSVGGLCCYDQANANGLLGITRAKEAGFDMCHFNLHKTFSSPHGSQGPGAGAQGVVEKLSKFLPTPTVEFDGEKYFLNYDRPHSIGKLRKFFGVPPVLLRAYAYITSLGADGLRTVAELSVLNNNYMLKRMLEEIPGLSCPLGEGLTKLEQARLSWEKLKQDTGVSTDDVCRRVVDYGLQSYFTSHHPRIIPEPFTPEPVETYSKDDIDEYVAIIKQIAHEAYTIPEIVKTAPHNSTISNINPEPLVNMDKFACTWRAYKKKMKN
jgi:glycine dehydrogenase subunit 2